MSTQTACSIRVPTEIIKSRMQTGMHKNFLGAISHTWAAEGARGFYKGYLITLMREIPFALLQFPIYEHLKVV